MRNNYNFLNTKKNPFAGKIKGRYNVTIHCTSLDDSKTQYDVKYDNKSFDEIKLLEQYRRNYTQN